MPGREPNLPILRVTIQNRQIIGREFREVGPPGGSATSSSRRSYAWSVLCAARHFAEHFFCIRPWSVGDDSRDPGETLNYRVVEGLTALEILTQTMQIDLECDPIQEFNSIHGARIPRHSRIAKSNANVSLGFRPCSHTHSVRERRSKSKPPRPDAPGGFRSRRPAAAMCQDLQLTQSIEGLTPTPEQLFGQGLRVTLR